MRQHVKPLDGAENPFVDLSLDAMCVADFDGNVKRANTAFAQSLGRREADVVARPFTDTVHPDDVELVRARFVELAASAELTGFECRHVRPDRSVLSMAWKSRPRRDEQLIYCVGRDVTESRRADDQLASLRRVATLVAEGASRSDLFAVAAAEVARVVGVPAVGILGYERDGTAVQLAGFASEVDVDVEVGAVLPLDGPSVASEIRTSGRAARIDDYAVVSGPMAEKVRSEGVRSAVGSPIIVAGRLWGAMVVYSPAPGALPRDTESRLADFTELLATAIANAESLEALHVLAEDQAALRRAATMVAEGLSASEIFAAICDDVGRLFDSEAGAIVRFETEPPSLIVMGIGSGIPGLAVGTRSELREEFAASQVHRTGRSGRIDARDLEVGSGPLLDPAARLGLSSTVASPVVVDGRLWGAISVSANAPFPRGTEARLERFGELIATAIASANAREALERLAGEQAALRRVATLVVQGAPSSEIFAAVSAEVPQLVGADNAHVSRFDGDDAFIVMGLTQEVQGITVGSRFEFSDWMTTAQVHRTGRAVRSDGVEWSNVDSAFGDAGHRLQVVSSVSGPIVVNGHLWGVITVTSSTPLPVDTEERLGDFTELVATAIANTESREALERLADEQAALRHVATLVAQGVPPSEIFSAVSAELDHLFSLDQAFVGRFDPSGAKIVAVGVAKPDGRAPHGSTWEHDDLYAPSRVFRTGRSARVDEHDLTTVGGPVAEWLTSQGFLAQLASPITVEGHLWGALTVTARQPFPGDAADRLEKFSELVATAIANADSKSELAASRRRIVAVSDEARRRIERDLHDGTQQRLIALGLEVRSAEADLPPDQLELRAALSHIGAGLTAVFDELQEISRGIHPAILSQDGLRPALRTLARRSPIPVNLDVATRERLPAPLEVAAYYVVSEALANAAKHSDASVIEVALEPRDDRVVVSIRDDGVGGADPRGGSGLVGLTDRLEALGGSIRVTSPPGRGTRIVAVLPRDLDQSTDATDDRPMLAEISDVLGWQEQPPETD